MKLKRPTIALLLYFFIDSARATEFEKLGGAISKALGTTEAFKTTMESKAGPLTLFYSKDKAGKPSKYAVVQKKTYEPNCTHTWVVAVDAKTAIVSDVRVVEMSCPHAFPTKETSYLNQYKGKGPADAKSLKEKVHTISKATGSSLLASEAVAESIVAVAKMKN